MTMAAIGIAHEPTANEIHLLNIADELRTIGMFLKASRRTGRVNLEWVAGGLPIFDRVIQYAETPIPDLHAVISDTDHYLAIVSHFHGQGLSKEEKITKLRETRETLRRILAGGPIEGAFEIGEIFMDAAEGAMRRISDLENQAMRRRLFEG